MTTPSSQACPKCSRPASVGSAFCTGCGAKLGNVCRSCNTPNALDSSFCMLCGARLSRDQAQNVINDPTPPQATPNAFSCPRCQLTLQPGADFCFSCNAPVLANAPMQTDNQGRVGTSHATLGSNSSACPRCRSVNEHGASFCFSCGLPFDKANIAPSHFYSRTRSAYRLGTPAGFWIRLLAYLIDLIVLIVADLIAGVLIGFVVTVSGGNIDDIGDVTLLLVSLTVAIVYYTIGISVYSTTIGKRVLGLYVLRPDDSKVGPGRALARYLSYIVSWVTLGIGFLMIAFSDNKRGLHDEICDTVVVRNR